MFGNFEIGKIFTKLVTSEKIRDLHLYLQFFFGDFSFFLRFCNICILYTPSAAGQKSHFFITKKSWKKSSMSPEFYTWNQRFGTFVDDLWWNFWFWSGGPPQRNGPKFLAKFPCKMAQNWGFLTSEPSRYIKMQNFFANSPRT